MVDMLLGLQSRGIIAGELVLREEKRVKGGRTTKWMVPMLTAESSADALTAGQGTVGSLGQGSAAELAEAPTLAPTPELIPGPRPDPADLDFLQDRVNQGHDIEPGLGEVIDLLPVDDEAQELEDALAPPPLQPERKVTALEVTFYGACADLASLPECDNMDVGAVRHALVQLVTRGRATSSKLLTDEERKTSIDLVAEVLAGQRRILGFGAKGLSLSKRSAEGAS
jgi:hypothetical protein